MNPIALGFLASLAAGLATGVGALPALLFKGIAERWLDALLGFAAGVMIAASLFGLLVPSFRLADPWIVGLGFLIGVGLLDFANQYVPHLHRLRGYEGAETTLGRAWLLLLAMVIHNMPEGLAVGVGFGDEQVASGMVIAIGIGLQNIPEGLAIAFALLREGYSRWRSVALATLVGLVEPIFGLIGITMVTAARFILPIGLAFAAGAMLYVVFQELIPESGRRGYRREATYLALLGILGTTVLAYYTSY